MNPVEVCRRVVRCRLVLPFELASRSRCSLRSYRSAREKVGVFFIPIHDRSHPGDAAVTDSAARVPRNASMAVPHQFRSHQRR